MGRLAAGTLSAGLLFVHVPVLTAAVGNGAWGCVDWLGIAGTLVVMFAVPRRWPVDPVGAD